MKIVKIKYLFSLIFSIVLALTFIIGAEHVSIKGLSIGVLLEEGPLFFRFFVDTIYLLTNESIAMRTYFEINSVPIIFEIFGLAILISITRYKFNLKKEVIDAATKKVTLWVTLVYALLSIFTFISSPWIDTSIWLTIITLLWAINYFVTKRVDKKVLLEEL